MSQIRRCTLANGKVLGEGCVPYIIAEMNSSHRGDMEVAKEMVLKAKEAGADCVKFQSWSAESLYSAGYYRENPISKKIVQKFALSREQQKELAAFCREQAIDFASTPYDESEIDFLVQECDVPFIKIASMEVNHPAHLRYAAATGKPVMLSTGMSSFEEVEKSVAILRKAGCRELVLFHCISVYPAEADTIQLRNITALKKNYPEVVIGFSDHSLGYTLAAASVALGASVIEKHMTLDKSKVGMDNGMAMEPEEFGQMVQACHQVYAALGTEERRVSEAELEQREKMRRSLIFRRDMKAGEVIREEDLYAKRPGTGIAPDRYGELLGKMLKKDVAADVLIRREDIE